MSTCITVVTSHCCVFTSRPRGQCGNCRGLGDWTGALKMLDVKMTDQLAGHEIAGHENDGRENAGHENAGMK